MLTCPRFHPPSLQGRGRREPARRKSPGAERRPVCGPLRANRGNPSSGELIASPSWLLGGPRPAPPLTLPASGCTQKPSEGWSPSHGVNNTGFGGGEVPESCVCMYAREKKTPLKKAYVTYLLEPWLEDCLGGFLCPLQVQQAGPGVLLSGRNMAWPGVCRNNKAQLAHKSTARWLTS